MENVDHVQTPENTFAKQVGNNVVGILAVYAGLKMGQELLSYDIPFNMEMGIAIAIGTYATRASD